MPWALTLMLTVLDSWTHRPLRFMLGSDRGGGGIEEDGRVVAPQRWRRTPAGSRVEDRVKQMQMKPFTKMQFPSGTPLCYLWELSNTGGAHTHINTQTCTFTCVWSHTVPSASKRVTFNQGEHEREACCVSSSPPQLRIMWFESLAPLIFTQLKTTIQAQGVL